MRKTMFRITLAAAGVILASGCASDTTGPSLSPSESAPLSAAISSDIAAAAGNAIASDLETLIANEAASVGSFALLSPSVAPSFDGDAPATSPPPPAPPVPEQPNCTASSQVGVFYCVKEPGAGDHLKCTYSEERKLFVCVKEEEPAGSPPAGEPKPAPQPAPGADQPAPQPQPESCAFNAGALIYTCTKSEEGKTVVKSYQFLDAAGVAMPSFIKGATEAIHFVVKTDASEVRDNNRSATHSLRDQILSGFLGPNRIWNGSGSSADTNSHVEGLSSRKYTGSSVDTLKAVTFVDQRSTHPYPLSGVSVRVVDYTVVSTGQQLETTTVHKRVVVTFNGTADVPITLGDYSCTLHLDTHKVDGCK